MSTEKLPTRRSTASGLSVPELLQPIARRQLFGSLWAGTTLAAIAAACSNNEASPSPTYRGADPTVKTTVNTTEPIAPVTTPPRVAPLDRSRRLQSLYLPMRDGVRIAADVWLPEAARGGAVPTAFRATRYHRAEQTDSDDPADNSNSDEAAFWGDRGYGFIVVDARGSGASFGSREVDLSADEIADYDEILTWIAAQPWSNGRIGAYGVSYDGDVAELLASTANRHLAAIAPQFSDFDPYRQLVYPGGVYLETPFSEWLAFNDVLDGVDGALERLAESIGVSPEALIGVVGTVAPVDGPDGPDLVAAAQREHQDNVRLEELLPAVDTVDVANWQHVLISNHREQVEASGVPILVQAGWYDAGVAAGAFQRFDSFSNPQQVWLGPWSHGGEEVLVPGANEEVPTFDNLSLSDQFARLGEFFDLYVRDGEPPGREKVLRFTTVGQPGWTETDRWPLPNSVDRTWYLDMRGLSDQPPSVDGALALPTTPHTSGEASRWRMNIVGDVVDYANWADGASNRTSFTGQTLDNDLWICGFPVVAADVVIDRGDGVLHAYLEHIDPEGGVHYLAEGLLRLSQRGSAQPDKQTALPLPRTFAGSDMAAVGIEVPTRVTFELFPLSALIPGGHRLQISFASTDTDNFASYTDGNAQMGLHLPASDPACLVLPTIER